MRSTTADRYLEICIRLVGIVGIGLSTWSAQAQTSQAQNQPAGAKGREADKTSSPRDDRRKALELSFQHRDLEALPLLEALAKAVPGDKEVQERLAFALMAKSVTVGPDEGAGLRRRARAIVLGLKKSGPISELGELLAEGIPADGALPNFSTQSKAEAAMKEGESAFVRRDFDAARRAYQRALRLDPHLYSAPLFVGDTYFVQGRLAEARTWFNRAVLIDPNKETAHRYLGDAQAKAGFAAAARLSYLDAVLAEPYSRAPWMALARWAKDNKVNLAHPRIVPEELDNGRDDQKGAGPVKPPADASEPDDGRSHWHRYAESRAAWAEGRFKRTFPKEAAYRHSLPEETDALRQVASAIAVDVKASRIKKPHPCFASLIRLADEGLLDAYVLYARPDNGIAQDYATYRATHGGELREYLMRYVAIGKAVETPGGAHN
jgi:tetratricopeptide (TPR) repeat protein